MIFNRGECMLFKTKKIFIIFIFLIAFVVLIPNISALECVSYQNGSGTEEDPYQITTNEELYSIKCNLDSHFVLMNDLDLTYDTTNENGLFYNEGKGWIAIGTNGYVGPRDTGFLGTLDGNNKTIKGLTQIRTLYKTTSSENYGGLFSKVSGTIKDLTFSDVNIDFTYNSDNTEYEYIREFYISIGSLSSISAGNIENIKATGNISINEITSNLSSYVNIGGIVGKSTIPYESNESSTINNSKNYVNIITNTNTQLWVGGIVGTSEGTNLTQNYNYGNITSNDSSSIGGISSTFSSYGIDNISVDKCYNYGDLKGREIGGIVGQLVSLKSFKNTANYGDIVAESAGGIVASAGIESSDNIVFENNFNAGNIYSKFVAGGIIGSSYRLNVKNSFNIGNIYITKKNDENYGAQEAAGGIVGITYGTINTSYNAGMIFYLDEYKNQYLMGELIGGRNENYSELTDSYYLIDELPSGEIKNCGAYCATIREILGTKINKQDFSKMEAYEKLDFENTWIIEENFELPQLIDNPIDGNYVNSVKIKVQVESIRYNDTLQLDVDVLPDNISDKDVIWKVENLDGSATITEDGLLTATKIGKVKVKVYSSDIGAYMDEVELEILPLLVEDIEIHGEDIIYVGNDYQYTLSFTPSENINNEIIWSVENKTGAATITNDGILTPISNGSVIIKATTKDGSEVYEEKEINIKTLMTNIEINVDSEDFYTNKTYNFTATILPLETSNKEIIWSSSNNEVATIDPVTGVLETKKVGTTTIEVRAKDSSNVSALITIEIKKNLELLNFEVLENFIYDGKIKTPKVLVMDDNYTLSEYVDYKLEYKNNITPETGIVVVTGINEYKGTKELTFKIEKANFEKPTSDKTCVYDGNYKSVDMSIAPLISGNTLIKFANEQGEYVLDELPVYKNVGTYIIKYKLTDTNNYYNDYYESSNLIITPAEINFDGKDVETFYDGNEYSIDMSGLDPIFTVKYEDNSGNYTLTQIPKYKEIGDYIIKYKITGNNYNQLFKQNTLRIFGIKGFDSTINVKNNILIFNNNNFNNLKSKIQLHSISNSIIHLDSNKNIISDDKIKTGDLLKININRNKDYEYELAYLGDVNGNGGIDIIDYIRVMKHIMGTSKLSGVYYESADMNKNNNIDIIDYIRIMKIIMEEN